MGQDPEDLREALEREKEARTRAERRLERIGLLARASQLLATSLDVDETLAQVVTLVLPTLGDFGFIDVVEEDGDVRRIAIAHEDPRRQEILAGTRWVRSTRTDINLCALSTGEAVIHPSIDAQWLENVAASPEHLALMKDLAFGSMLSAPLSVRGRLLGAITLFYGDSRRRHDDEELELVCELGSRTAIGIDNARLYRAARVADRRKDEFLAMLGHELRNPLAPIATAVELMRLKDPDAHARERQIIERQVDHLVRLVDDLLDVSRITRGKIELHRRTTEAAHVVAKAVEQASPLFERMRHELTIEVPTEGLALDIDEHRVAQVLANLLNNAAKYTPHGGRVAVRARGDGDDVVFEVEDDGRGIDPELLPNMFELFAQGEHAKDRSEGGLGLGLAIAQSLVKLHQGSIEAHSEGPGRGSRFTVRLPRTNAETRPRTPVRPGLASGEVCARILVVDDNADAANLLADALREDGHEVQIAHDGPSAIALGLREQFDVALLDIGLPVMDGYEVAERLRRGSNRRMPRLFAVTGYGLKSDRARSEAAGFEAHLVKPVDIGALRVALRKT